MSDRNHAGHPARSWIPVNQHLATGMGTSTVVYVPVVNLPQISDKDWQKMVAGHRWWECECRRCATKRRQFMSPYGVIEGDQK